jgi:hypothetical protein
MFSSFAPPVCGMMLLGYRQACQGNARKNYPVMSDPGGISSGQGKKEKNLFGFSFEHDWERNCDQVANDIGCEDSRKYPAITGHGSRDKQR